MKRYADVIVPLAIPGTLTYLVPDDWKQDNLTGRRVLVSVGQAKIYTALVLKDFAAKPEKGSPRELLELIDQSPIVSEIYLNFYLWIADYYCCSPGEVFLSAVPSGLRLSTDTLIVKGEREPQHEIEDDAFMILDALSMQDQLTLTEISAILGRKSIHKLLTFMHHQGWIAYGYEAKEKVKPRKIKWLLLPRELQNENSLKLALDELNRAPKQQEMFMAFLSLCDWFNGILKPVQENDLLAAAGKNKAVLKNLTERGLLLVEETNPEGINAGPPPNKPGLSKAQTTALENIKSAIQNQKTPFLHGVTGSGKTEIYLEFAAEFLEQGKDVLFLVPEIALTSQMLRRISSRFPGDLLVYHSRLSDGERVTVWQQIQRPGRERGFLILGARSALFLALHNPGLIILDEEQDSSYKQHDPAPRYHTRDAALFLGHTLKIPVLLGSATPSAESWYLIQNQKFERIALDQRFGNAELPSIQLIDLGRERKIGRLSFPFSVPLKEAMDACLAEGKQIILFQNRRGFAPHIQCQSCGDVPQCPYCDISLTYHKYTNELRCHCCGHSTAMPNSCQVCQSSDIQLSGLGTERVEEELQALYPTLACDRLDLDNTRKKQAFAQIIEKFERRETQILVGTQMITKGLDFENVGLVGILNADTLLYYPDFRASEKALQMLLQVAGRAGRRDANGKVFVQTFSPEHPVIKSLLNNDYSGLLEAEFPDRNKFEYPPFCRLIRLELRHRNQENAYQDACWFAESLRRALPDIRIDGPEAPIVARKRNKFFQHILIRIPRTRQPGPIKKHIQKLALTRKKMGNSPSDLFFDVDP
jgi:primosomal protein N' (replication factor Y) (superfamily II helicase)